MALERDPRIPIQLATAGSLDGGGALETTAAAPETGSAGEDSQGPRLDDPALFLNRELTWLDFNARVLAEAENEENALLERVKFLAIVASNQDEFVMKRIGGLKQQVEAGVVTLTVDGRSPSEQIEECYERIRAIDARKWAALRVLGEQLVKHGIHLTPYEELSERHREKLRQHYYDNIFPLVTPQTSDPAHPFPFISNLSLNLLVTYRPSEESAPLQARVKVPVGVGISRFLQLDDEKRTYVPLESVMRGNLDLLFPGAIIDECALFRVTRNANTERDEDQADDLLALIETEMQDRRFAPIVRLEVSRDMPPVLRGMLAAELGLDEADVFEIDGMAAIRDLMELTRIPDPDLHDPPFAPVEHPSFVRKDLSCFHVIREADSLLVHHPYQSYAASVERFLADAHRDPKVRAIKMTLYRTDAGSKAIDYLIEAARNGKQVAAVVELKARFEEEANIRWANRLEEAGVHVTYGVLGLKTHCKVILVVRQDYNGLRRYAHIGTGNYNAETARLYTDFGLFTCDPQMGQDLTELFNYLSTGYKPKRSYHKILPSPKLCKPALMRKIDREIEHSREGRGGHIQIKTNALEDADLTRSLYRASLAGVRVDLIVRDSCRIRAGLPGFSENVRVISVVGRFLEHSRVYHFGNGGEDEYYIGSADAMKRNLESRVEVLVPVEAPELRKELQHSLRTLLSDTHGAWQMTPDGGYERLHPDTDEEERSAQRVFIERAAKQNKQAKRLKKRGPRSTPRRQKN